MNNFPKVVHYTNNLGARKEVSIHEKEDDKYPVFIWDLDTWEFNGCYDMTAERLNAFLEHYGIDERMD